MFDSIRNRNIATYFLWITSVAFLALAAFVLAPQNSAYLKCEDTGWDDSKFYCVELFFATPRALVSTFELQDADRHFLQLNEPADREGDYFAREPNVGPDNERSEPQLILGRSLVHVPFMKVKGSRDEGAPEERDEYVDIDSAIKPAFASSTANIVHVALSTDGITRVQKAHFNSIDQSIEEKIEEMTSAGGANDADGDKKALLFVHGYQTSFSDSIKGAARLAANLSLDKRNKEKLDTDDRDTTELNAPYALGQPLLYTWPTPAPDAGNILVSGLRNAIQEAIKLPETRGTKPDLDEFINGFNAGWDFGVDLGRARSVRENALGDCVNPATEISPIIEALGSVSSKKVPGAVFANATFDFFVGALSKTNEEVVGKYLQGQCRAQGLDAVPGLLAYLQGLDEHTDIKEINIVAYSMGAEVAVRALEQFSEWRMKERQNHELAVNIIYYGADVFEHDYRKIVQATIVNARNNNGPWRSNLYSNRNDLALLFSTFLNLGETRAGRIANPNAEPLILKDAEQDEHITVDISALSRKLTTGDLNHSMIKRSPLLLADMACFFKKEVAADGRYLRKVNSGEYWIYDKDATKVDPECAGALWETDGIDCSSVLELMGKKIESFFGANRYDEALKECESANRDFFAFCKNNPESFWCRDIDFGPIFASFENKSDPPSVQTEEFLGSFDLCCFKSDKAVLTPEMELVLQDEMSEIAARYDVSDLWFEVHGFASTKNTDAHNLDLSQRRAGKVAGVLRDEFGIDESQIKPIQGFGETELAIDTDDEVDEPRNRRVTVRYGRVF